MSEMTSAGLIEHKADDETPTHDVRIADALVADIINWRIKPGGWIREREIAERFSVSHGPVREAFRRLERDGFVEVVPWRGARVVEFSAQRARDVIELWKLLFSMVCGLAAMRISDEDARILMQLIVGYEATVRVTTDPVEHFRASNFVGQFISDRCGNQAASETLLRVARHTRWQYGLLRAKKFARQQPAAGIKSAELFRRVVEAIVAKDPVQAEAAARELMAFPEATFAEAVADYLAAHKPPKPSARKQSGAAAKRPRAKAKLNL
ncbi:MAG: GntR family transcriptional regulator [Pseudomonadota bacterium]|nr:GntR family transcriptional regulator [Pseudomonadota bacterium]